MAPLTARMKGKPNFDLVAAVEVVEAGRIHLRRDCRAPPRSARVKTLRISPARDAEIGVGAQQRQLGIPGGSAERASANAWIMASRDGNGRAPAAWRGNPGRMLGDAAECGNEIVCAHGIHVGERKFHSHRSIGSAGARRRACAARLRSCRSHCRAAWHAFARSAGRSASAKRLMSSMRFEHRALGSLGEALRGSASAA